MNCTDLFAKFRPELDYTRLAARPDVALKHWKGLLPELQACVRTQMLDYYTIPFVSNFLEAVKAGSRPSHIKITNDSFLLQGSEQVPWWVSDGKNTYISPGGQIIRFINEKAFSQTPKTAELKIDLVADEKQLQEQLYAQQLLLRLQQYNEYLGAQLTYFSRYAQANYPNIIGLLLDHGIRIDNHYQQYIHPLTQIDLDSISDPIMKEEIHKTLDKLEELRKNFDKIGPELCERDQKTCSDFINQSGSYEDALKQLDNN